MLNCFQVVIPQDKVSLNFEKSVIKNLSFCHYACILHDKDGIKPHYHVVISQKKPFLTVHHISEALKIDTFYIHECGFESFNEAILYLLHWKMDGLTKIYSYNKSKLITNYNFSLTCDNAVSVCS